LTAAYVVARRAIALTASLDPSVEGYVAIKAVTAFTTLAIDGRTSLTASSGLDIYRDVLPIGHPEFSNAAVLPIKTLRAARAEWLAADPRIADEYRPLVASAFGATPGSLEQRHARARLDRVDSHSVPLDIVLAPLIAAARKIDIAALKARVADQLRDPHTGQWIEEGHFAMFDLKGPSGKIRKVFGQLVGGNDMLGYGEIHVTDDPDLGTGVVKVNKANITAVGGMLTDENLEKAGVDPQGKQRVYLNTDAQSLNDLAKTMDVAPSDWTWDANEDNSNGSKGAFISADGFKAVPVGEGGQNAKTFDIFDADDKPIETLQGEGWGNIQGGLQKIRQDMAKKVDAGKPATESTGTAQMIPAGKLQAGDKVDVAGKENTVVSVSKPYKYKVKPTDLKQTKSGYRNVVDVTLEDENGERVTKRWNPATEIQAIRPEGKEEAPAVEGEVEHGLSDTWTSVMNGALGKREQQLRDLEKSFPPDAAATAEMNELAAARARIKSGVVTEADLEKVKELLSQEDGADSLFTKPGSTISQIDKLLKYKFGKDGAPRSMSQESDDAGKTPIEPGQKVKGGVSDLLDDYDKELQKSGFDVGMRDGTWTSADGRLELSYEDDAWNVKFDGELAAKVTIWEEDENGKYYEPDDDSIYESIFDSLYGELTKDFTKEDYVDDMVSSGQRSIQEIKDLGKLPDESDEDFGARIKKLEDGLSSLESYIRSDDFKYLPDSMRTEAYGTYTPGTKASPMEQKLNSLLESARHAGYKSRELYLKDLFAKKKAEIDEASKATGPSPDAAAEGKVKAKNKAEAKGKMAEPATDAQKNYVKAMLKNPAVPDDVRSRIQADLDEQGDAINKNDIGLHIAELKNYPSKSLPTDKMYNSIQRELYARGASPEEVDKILADLPNMDKKQASDLIGSLKEKPDLAGEEATKNGFEETTNESDKYDGQRRWTKVEAGKRTTVLLNGDGWRVNHQSNVDPATGTWNDSQMQSIDHDSEKSSSADDVFKNAADTHETLGAKEELPIDESAVAADVAAEVKELSDKQKEPATDKQRAFVDSLLANPKVPADVKSDIESKLAAKPDMNKAEIGEIIGALKKLPGSDAPTSKMLNSVKRELIARGVPVNEANETRANLDGMSKSEVSDLISKLKSKDDAAGAQAAANGFVEATTPEDQAGGVRRFNLLGSDDELLAALTLDGEGFTVNRKDENGEDDELFLGRNLGSFERIANAAKAAQDLKNTDVTKTPGFDSESDREKKIATATYNRPGDSGTWMEGKTPDGQRGWSYYDADGNVTEVTENPDGSFTRRSSDAPEPVTFDSVDEAFSLDSKPSDTGSKMSDFQDDFDDIIEAVQGLDLSGDDESSDDTPASDLKNYVSNQVTQAEELIKKGDLLSAQASLALAAADANDSDVPGADELGDALNNAAKSIADIREAQKALGQGSGGGDEPPSTNAPSSAGDDDFENNVRDVSGDIMSIGEELDKNLKSSAINAIEEREVADGRTILKNAEDSMGQAQEALAAGDTETARKLIDQAASQLADASDVFENILDQSDEGKAVRKLGKSAGDLALKIRETLLDGQPRGGGSAGDRIFGKAGISDDRIMQAMEDVDDWVASEKGNEVSGWDNKVGNLDQMISSFNDEPEARMQKTAEALYELGRELEDNGYKDSANTLFDMSKALSDEFYGDSDEDEDETSTSGTAEYAPATDWTPAENGFNFTGGDEPGEVSAALAKKKKKVEDLIADGDYGGALDELFDGAASIPMSRAMEDDLSGSYDGIQDGDVFYQNADTIVYKTKDGRWRVYSKDETDGFIDTGEPATDQLADELLKEMMAPKSDWTQARFYDPRLNDLFHANNAPGPSGNPANHTSTPNYKISFDGLRMPDDWAGDLGLPEKGEEEEPYSDGELIDTWLKNNGLDELGVKWDPSSTETTFGGANVNFEIPEGAKDKFGEAYYGEGATWKDLEDDEIPEAIEGGEPSSSIYSDTEKAAMNRNIGDSVVVVGKKGKEKPGKIIGVVPSSIGQYIVEHDDGSTSLPWYFDLKPEGAETPSADKKPTEARFNGKIGDSVVVVGKKGKEKPGKIIGYVPGSIGQYIVEHDDGSSSLPWYFDMKADGLETPSADGEGTTTSPAETEKPKKGNQIGERIVVIGKKGKEKPGKIIGYVPGSIGQYIVEHDDGTTSLPWSYETKPEGGETNLGSSGRSSEQVARDAENAKKTANELAAEWNSKPFPIADPDSLASEESLTKMRNILLDGATNSDYFGPALKAIDDPNLSGTEKLQRIADALTERGVGSDGKGVDLPNANPGLPLNGDYSGREKALWAKSNITRALNLNGIFSTKEKEAGKDKLSPRLQKIVDAELKKRSEGDEGNEGTGGVDPKVPSPSKPGGGGAEASTSENSSPELTSKVEGTNAQLTKRFASRDERDAWLKSIPKGAEAGIAISISSPTDFDFYNKKREHYEVKIDFDTRTEGLGVPKGLGAGRKKAIEWAEKEGFDLSEGEHSSESLVPKVNVDDKITMSNIRFDDKIDQAEKIEAKLKPGEEKDSARLRIKLARDKISKARKARLDGDLEESEKLTEEASAELTAMAEDIEKYMVSPKSQDAKYGLKNKEIREDAAKLAKAVEAVTAKSRIAFAEEKEAKSTESSASSSSTITGDKYKKLIDNAYEKYDPGVAQHSWDTKGIGESIMSHLTGIADDIKSGKELDAKDAAKKMRQLASMYNELADAATGSEGEDGAEWSTDDSSIQDLIQGAQELEKQADLLDPKAVDSPKAEAPSEPDSGETQEPISVDSVLTDGSLASKITKNADMDAAELEQLSTRIAKELENNPQLAAVLKLSGDSPILSALEELNSSNGESSQGLEGDLNVLRDTLDSTIEDSELIDSLTRLLKSVEKKNNTKNLTGFKKISEAKGSNPGGIYEDPKTGERFYVKFPKSTLHGENEALASAIYEELGVRSVKVEQGELDGKPVTYTRMIDGAKSDLKDKLSDKFYMKQLQEGFAVDALLANWDVAGLEYDNVVSDAEGLPVRVDPGGALLFRAQGTPKTDDQFNENVPELDTFTDKNSSRPAAKIFSSMTASEKLDSAVKLSDLDDDVIDNLVNEHISDEAAADKLKKLLKARRDNILSKLVSSKVFEDEASKQGESSEPDEEFPPYAYGEKKSHSEGDRVDVLWDPKNGVEMTGEVVSGPTEDQMYKIRLDDSKVNGDQAGNVITANIVSLRPEQAKPNFDEDEKPAAAPEVKTSTGELKPGDKVVYKDGSTGTIVKADKNPKYVHVAMDSKGGKLQIKALSKLTKVESAPDEKAAPALSPSGKKIVPKPTAKTVPTKTEPEPAADADATSTGFTNFKDANGVTWSSSITQKSNGDTVIKWDGTNGETFPVYLELDSFAGTWKVMKTDWAGHPFLVKDTWDSDSAGALNFVANEIKGGQGATDDLGDEPSIVPLKPVGNDMLAFNDGNGTTYPELPSVVLLKDPDSADSNPKYWIQIEPAADQNWSPFEDHMSSPATRSLAEAISIVNSHLKNKGVTKENVDSQVGDKEVVKWDVYGPGLVTSNVDTKALAETGLMSPVDPTKPMFRVKETPEGSLDLVIVPPDTSGLDLTAITVPDSESLDVAVSEALAADYKETSNYTPNEKEINWIQALSGNHLKDTSKWDVDMLKNASSTGTDVTKSGNAGDGYIVDSKQRPIGKGELVVLSDGRTGILAHVGLPDGEIKYDAPQPTATIVFADGSTEAVDSDKIRGIGRSLSMGYNAGSELTRIKRRYELQNMEKTGVDLTPEQKAAAASKPFFTGRIVKDAKGEEGFIVEDKGDGYFKVQFGDGHIKSRAGSKLTATDKQVRDYNGLMYTATHVRKGYVKGLMNYGQTGGEGLAVPVQLSDPGQKTTAAGVSYGNVKVTKNALGAQQVVVDNPLPPTESGFTSIPSLSTAVETTLNPDDPQAALRGASAAWDSDSIEDLDVRFMRAINEKGEDSLSAKFKLTAWAGDAFINDLMKRAAEGDQSVTITDALRVPKQVINSNGVLSYDPSELSAAGLTGAAYSSSEGTTATVTLDDGTKIVFMRADNATKAKGEGVNLSSGTNVIAFHNKVLVLFPEGAKNDPDAIAKVLAQAGVRDSRPATEADAKTLIENRLISIFAGKTNPKTNPGGATRATLLDEVKAKFDIGPEDVTMSTGGGGRVEMRLSEEKAKALAKKTNIAHFKHTWHSTGQIAQNMGESDEDFRDRVADAVAAKLATPQGGLLSTTTRWTEGIPTSGMSSASDVKTGGGDYVFLTPQGAWAGKSGSYYNGAPTIYFSPEKLFRRLDFWANATDKYGARSESKTAMTDMVPGSYEAMFKQRVSFDDLDSLQVRTDAHRDALIKALKKRGVYDFGGVPIEQIIQVS